MLKEFVKECLFFKTKSTLNVLLGIIAWLNIFQIVLTVIKMCVKQ